ncbi:MAG: hypothetical protein KDC56_02310 [Flavobacteriaceae bacterium]|nr:hypothetical protein [Flavobacteriaceae bacterium]
MGKKQPILQHVMQIPGWHTDKKIFVFESDDWGSIRMPSKQVYQSLIKNGVNVGNNDNWHLDCLESGEDIEKLFSIIAKYKDCEGNFPRFTMNMVMGNPDFEKIKKSKFETYYHEHFFDSYKRYHGSDLQQIWNQGIQERFIKPQFHAREHLNVALWLKDLKQGFEKTKVAFDYEFFSLITSTSSPFQRHYLAAYWAESSEELSWLEDILQQGLYLFKNTFGFKSESFVACNYIWPKELEPILLNQGIKIFQSQRGQLQPDPFKKGKAKIKRHYTGQRNSLGQFYTIRNVKFEPFENENTDWVDRALKDIRLAFFWKKPAIVSTHRVNYVGGIDVKHRDRNLKALDLLLKKVLELWPEVIFLTSDQLGSLIKKNMT